MRDIVFTLVFVGLVPLALSRPYIAACLWAWISIMNPHTLTFGFARSLPWAAVAAGVAMAALLFNAKRRAPFPWSTGSVLVLLLMFWMTVTSVFSLNHPTLVWERWSFVMKIFVMLVISLMLINGRDQIEKLILVIVASVAFYGVKGGIFTILSGGSSRVWGPPGGMIADNNSIAIAIVIVLPWMYYLYVTAEKKWIKNAFLWSMILSLFAVLGTQSRGALVSILVMLLMLGLKSKNAIRTSIGLVALAMLAITFMPDSWSSRMETIAGYGGDSSAQSRIWTWKTLWAVALDRPFVGGGFRSDSLEVFNVYSPIELRGTFANQVYVAHSIYMQALGEHGFPGLFIYLGIGTWTWRTASKLGKETKNHAEFSTWVPILMRMCQVSIAGFAAGGAFLSLMILDLPYYVFAVVALVKVVVMAEAKERKTEKSPNLTVKPI